MFPPVQGKQCPSLLTLEGAGGRGGGAQGMQVGGQGMQVGGCRGEVTSVTLRGAVTVTVH